MKSKQKQTPTEIIDNQRQAVVEKIIEDMERYEEELGKNIEIDAPELEEEVSLAGESHDMAIASEHQPESEMPENVLSTVL